MSYPRKYPTGTGDNHVDENDWNAMVDLYNGFTPSGTFHSPYTYFIDYDGVDYAACNAFQIVYGGASDAGGVDGADFAAVRAAAKADIEAVGYGSIWYWDGQYESDVAPTTIMLYEDAVWDSIWDDTHIYSPYRWKLRNVPNSAERVFAAVFDVDAADRTGGDTVAVYSQVMDDAHTTADTWGFNTVVAKTGNHKVISMELDLNNNYADETAYSETKPSAGLVINNGGTKKPYVQIISGADGANWKHGAILYGWETTGLMMKSAISAPDAYLLFIPNTDADTSTRMIKLFNNAMDKEIFGLYKDGTIAVHENNAGSKAFTIKNTSGSAGSIFNLINATDAATLMYFTNAGLMNIFNYLTVDSPTDVILSGITTGDANSRVLIKKAEINFGNGTDAVDATVKREVADWITVNPNLKVDDTLNVVTEIQVNSTKVVGTQQGAIGAPAGGATVDSEARTAIGSILTALRNHGLIAT